MAPVPKQQAVAGAPTTDWPAAMVAAKQREPLRSRHFVTTDATNSAGATWGGANAAAYTLSNTGLAPTSYSASDLLGHG